MRAARRTISKTRRRPARHHGPCAARPGMLPLVGAGLLCCGCQQQSQRTMAEREDARAAWQHTSVSGAGAVAHPQSVTVAEGSAPLVYQVPHAGVAHVRDATSGQEIAAGAVERGTLLRVDEDRGVFANGQRLRPGPLPAGHAYSISLDLDQADTWRSRILAPRPAKPAVVAPPQQTQPAAPESQ